MRFFRVLALHYISCAKHTFWRKKRLRASKKNGVDANEETLERGRRKASRVPRRAMPSFARLFFSVMVVVLLAKRRYAFLCGVRKLNAKKKLFWDKKRRRRRKGRRRKKERKAKERPDDFIIIIVVVVVVVPLHCSPRRRRRSSSYGTSTHRIQKSLPLLILFPLVLTRRAPKKLRHRFVGASRLDQQKVRDVVGAFWTSTARRVDVFPRVVAP